MRAGEVADIYRALRKGREDSADVPGGDDLYVGEQLMRRRELRERTPQTTATRARRSVLALYGWVGGYGVRPALPFAALVVLLAAATVLVGMVGLQKGSPVDALIFALRSMLLLPNSTHIVTTTVGDGLQVALRVLGPVLIALVALGVRSQVKR